MAKRGLFGIFGIFALAVVLFFSFSVPSEGGEKVYMIGITQIVTHPALDACRKGFIDQMAEEGFKEGKNVKYDISSPEGDMSLAANIARKFVSQKVDLILSIATPTTQACYKAAKGTSIPVIFGAMTDPVSAGVADSWEKPGGNVTGCSDWMDVGTQIKLLMEICPNTKKVGTLYNAGEVNSKVQIEELRKAAPGLGIEEVVEATANTTSDVLSAINSLVGRVDAVWLPTDNTMISALEGIIKVCEDQDLPLFGSDTAHVDRGVIAASGVNYYTLGRESGKISARVLKGESPAVIPVKRCPMTDLAINPLAAKRMGVQVPESVMKKATRIVEK